MSSNSLFLLVLLLGCRDSDGFKVANVDSGSGLIDTNSGAERSVDSDGDGFPDSEDCDDEDGSVHPDVPEICDGIDNDCDGLIDDEDDSLDLGTATDWYQDADGDSYGAEGVHVLGCEPPESYVAISVDGFDCDDTDPAYHPGADESDCTDPADYNCDGSVGYADADGDGFAACEDCDDSDADTHPSRTEVCDGLDNDCDGWVDDEDDSLDESTATEWFIDLDGDTYGDERDSVLSCEPPDSYVEASEDGFDCDDTDSAFHPGADESDCTDPSDYNCDGSVGYADGDGDGFSACEDCDDGDPSVHPEGTEICDGLDNDCDGAMDDADPGLDSSTAYDWYADADGDGFGDPDHTVRSCEAAAGHVADHSDCDDTSASIYLGADEVCDGVDNNCNGLVDEAEAADARSWFADIDGDGFGDAAAEVVACEPPAHHVADSTDCDDGSESAYPGAEELCDGLDNNCDGTVDEDEAADARDWYADTDADGFGDSGAGVRACEPPSGHVADATDCDDGSAEAYPGGEEVCDGLDNNCDGEIDEPEATDARTWYTDGDGDGYGDLSHTVRACEPSDEHVADHTDCDDSDPGIHPGAAEACDGSDNDCDGTADSSDVCPCDVRYQSDTEHPYMFCTSSRSWSDASGYCQSYGYELVSLNDGAENTWVDDTADGFSTDKWHMGLTDQWSEGTWVWANGDPVSYTNWQTGEPNGGTTESCAQLNRYHPAQSWNDEPCDQSLRFVCEVD